jgi:hypothetical protein
MSGRGPAPKDPSRRVRHGGKGQPDWTVLQFESAAPPDLPEGHEWALQTRKWWEMWKLSPQSALFGQSDWYFLLDTALIHTEVWGGNTALAAELRLRVSKLGATVEDRLQTCLTTNLAASYLKVEVGDLPLLQHTCQVPVVPRETS